MRRPGFSLLEVLLSLALLGTLAVAVVGWTASVLEMRQRRAESEALHASASRVWRAVSIDLLGDDLRLPAWGGREHRVWMEGTALHVLTRDAGLCEVVYRADSDGTVVRAVRRSEPGQSAPAEIVAQGLIGWRWSIEADSSGPIGAIVADWDDGAGGRDGVRFEVARGWLP